MDFARSWSINLARPTIDRAEDAVFSIDEDFMSEIGILNMPREARDHLQAGIEESIRNKVLIEIADDLTDESQAELEKIGESQAFARLWLAKHRPDYEGSMEFAEFRELAMTESDSSAEQLFAYNSWFGINLPSFVSIVEAVRESVKQELKAIGKPI